MGTPLKGRDLVFKLFDSIKNCDFINQLKFVVLGDLSKAAKEKIYQYHFVEYIGRYKTDDLNELLETLQIQVGIVPSIWEEAYGYVGVEFLAKGIPVLGNNIGGISDYLYTSETGWLNNSCTAEGLFDLIQKIIKHPFEIEIINQNLILNRKKYIKELEYHFEEMDAIYKNLVSAV
jgi:glycosyltransferase involved in cell wall biosynthesis